MEGRNIIKKIYCSPQSSKCALGLLHPSVVFVVSSVGTIHEDTKTKPRSDYLNVGYKLFDFFPTLQAAGNHIIFNMTMHAYTLFRHITTRCI